MKFNEYRFLVLSDLYRITGDTRLTSLFYLMVLGDSFKYIFWMRTCRYLGSKTFLKHTISLVARLMLRRYRYKFGVDISPSTEIGSGFYVGHFGCIVVNAASQIGKNCNISQGVTLGFANRGKNRGAPKIGDNVYIGPGAKIVGAVEIGNEVAIGANCVVTTDIPDQAVVVGVPAKIVSYAGSSGYITRTDYDYKIKL